MNRRLEVVRQTLRRQTLGGSLHDWVWNVASPRCEWLAQRKVSIRDRDDDLLEVTSPRLPTPLYFPKELNPFYLYQTVTEQEYSQNWHSYERFGATLSADDVVFDCGAAEGIFSWRVCRTAREVVAFEPLPEYLRGLHKTFADHANVRIEPVALGDCEGEAYLKKAGISTHITDEVTADRVRITTIDAWIAKHGLPCTYLKADLEGFEIPMLRGAMETLRTHRPKVSITTYHRQNDPDEIAALLRAAWPGYRIKTKGIEAQWGNPIMLHAWS